MDLKANSRLEQLRAREKHLREALAIEQTKIAKRQRREADREHALIGEAVVKAALASPQFRLAVSQVALAQITDEKQRNFLRRRGWGAQ
jgi:hypothetical protein